MKLSIFLYDKGAQHRIHSNKEMSDILRKLKNALPFFFQKKSLFIKVLSVFFILFSNGLFGDSIIDTDTVKLRPPSVERKAKFETDKDFNYHPDIDRSKNKFELWFDRMMKKISDFFESLRKKLNIDINPAVWRWMGYIICFAVIAFIIMRLSGFNFKRLFVRTSATQLPYSILEENIHEINIEQQYQNAVDAKNYRLAIRYRFLSILKTLHDNNQIEWRIDKANAVYVYELSAELSAQYSVYAREFDYIWYGDFAVDAETFETIKTQMIRFEKSISLKQKTNSTSV